jgi:hypothetical protein
MALPLRILDRGARTHVMNRCAGYRVMFREPNRVKKFLLSEHSLQTNANRFTMGDDSAVTALDHRLGARIKEDRSPAAIAAATRDQADRTEMI